MTRQASIFEARDMVAMGVFTHGSMYDKPLLISERLFWRNITMNVPVARIMRRKTISIEEMAIKAIWLNLYSPLSGRQIVRMLYPGPVILERAGAVLDGPLFLGIAGLTEDDITKGAPDSTS
jgi:hypothetical protein